MTRGGGGVWKISKHADVIYEWSPSELNGDLDKCPANSQCVEISKCGKQEFLKDAPPTTCGYTEAGEDMVCCSGKVQIFWEGHKI